MWYILYLNISMKSKINFLITTEKGNFVNENFIKSNHPSSVSFPPFHNTTSGCYCSTALSSSLFGNSQLFRDFIKIRFLRLKKKALFLWIWQQYQQDLSFVSTCNLFLSATFLLFLHLEEIILFHFC